MYLLCETLGCITNSHSYDLGICQVVRLRMYEILRKRINMLLQKFPIMRLYKSQEISTV